MDASCAGLAPPQEGAGAHLPVSNGKALAHVQAFEAWGDYKDQANE
jgi:hypothetical protein